jgi:hypothetical protein
MLPNALMVGISYLALSRCQPTNFLLWAIWLFWQCSLGDSGDRFDQASRCTSQWCSDFTLVGQNVPTLR